MGYNVRVVNARTPARCVDLVNSARTLEAKRCLLLFPGKIDRMSEPNQLDVLRWVDDEVIWCDGSVDETNRKLPGTDSTEYS